MTFALNPQMDQKSNHEGCAPPAQRYSAGSATQPTTIQCMMIDLFCFSLQRNWWIPLTPLQPPGWPVSQGQRIKIGLGYVYPVGLAGHKTRQLDQPRGLRVYRPITLG